MPQHRSHPLSTVQPALQVLFSEKKKPPAPIQSAHDAIYFGVDEPADVDPALPEPQELGASFGLSPEVLHGMHAARVMTVHHDERGTIHQVQVGQGPMPTPVPDAAQLLADRGVRPPLVPA